MGHNTGNALVWLALGGAIVSVSGCGPATDSELLLEAGEAEAVQAFESEIRLNSLPQRQAQTVLKLVDDICADTWCAGDYDFAFRRLACRLGPGDGLCKLTLQIFPREGVPSARRAYVRSCSTRGYFGFSSLVETAPNGYQSLNTDYYDALTECIGRLESRLPRG